MTIEEIKNPNDVLEFMKEHIKYGWLDINGNKHVGEMNNIRSLYKTISLEETLINGIGTCIEQVNLMNYLLNKINIPTKMFCTRVYEDENYDEINSDIYMHCFVLYYLGNKVYHLEHPNWERVNIYEYENEEKAIEDISLYYLKKDNGKVRTVTAFYEVEPNLTFKEFNNYINSLDNKVK